MSTPITQSRTSRTRARLMAACRDLLAEQGPQGISMAAVAARAGTSRQTLYNHWPSLEHLMIDVMLGEPGYSAVPDLRDARSATVDYLSQLAERLGDPATFSVVLSVIGASRHDAGAREALDQLVDLSHGRLNEYLARVGTSVPRETFARLVGPVIFEIFFTGRSPEGAVIERIVDAG
jgi:AcrR family transcriptional regulator